MGNLGKESCVMKIVAIYLRSAVSFFNNAFPSMLLVNTHCGLLREDSDAQKLRCSRFIRPRLLPADFCHCRVRSRRTEAEALLPGVTAPVTHSDVNKWLNGLSPEERQRIRDFYQKRYEQIAK
jgi:hypothetical protein